MTIFDPNKRRQMEQDAAMVGMGQLPMPGELLPTETRRGGEDRGWPEIDVGGGNRVENEVTPSLFGQKRMGDEQAREAQKILQRYKDGKVRIETRVKAANEWWRRNDWEQIEKDGLATKVTQQQRTSTGWLFNSILGKHADAMDAYPEPVILPRMQDDEEQAHILSDVIPVIMEQNGYEEVYSDVSWQKFREGTGITSVCWDKDKLNGLGDIAISRVNILNIFWEPGIRDIQRSRNVFLVQEVDSDLLEQEYPQMKDKARAQTFSLAEYGTDEKKEHEGKSLVIDWYYHRKVEGRNILHYAKICNGMMLYASEDDPAYADRGWYDDGLYPFVLDPLFPDEGSPAGRGYIDVAKDIQTDIDVMNSAMVANVEAGSRPRYFSRNDGGINEDEMADTTKQIVHVEGTMDSDSLRAFEVPSIPSYATTMLAQKIDEIKFVTGNTDVQNGSKPSGVTAASALAMLAETGGRTSKDSSQSAYRAYSKIVTMVIERIRQFYDVPRIFRILGESGPEYVSFDNSGLQPQPLEAIVAGMLGDQVDPMTGMPEEQMMRLPVFDVEVDAQRENPYSKASQNELSIQLFGLGVFNPQLADQAQMLLEMMDFKGKDKLLMKIRQNGTLVQLLQQIAAIAMVLAGKYEPMTAAQIQQLLAANPATAAMAQQMQMQQQPMSLGGNEAAEIANGTSGAMKGGMTRMNNAREQVANASRPE